MVGYAFVFWLGDWSVYLVELGLSHSIETDTVRERK